jgi:transcriptional regulator with XRE-family HTH domain
MNTSLSERKIIGKNIRRLREEQELGQTEAANECDIERTYWIDIENGTANATFEKYARIAKFLGVSVRELLTDNVAVYAQSGAPSEKRSRRRSSR